jgi:hypothetical protein
MGVMQSRGKRATKDLANEVQLALRGLKQVRRQSLSELIGGGNTLCPVGDCPRNAVRIFVVGAIIQQSAVLFFLTPPHCLKKNGTP